MGKSKEIIAVSFGLAGVVILARYTPQIQYYLSLLNSSTSK